MCDSPTGASLSHFDLRLRRRPGTPGTGHKRTWTTIHAVVNSEFTGNNITACNVLTSQAGAYEVCFLYMEGWKAYSAVGRMPGKVIRERAATAKLAGFFLNF